MTVGHLHVLSGEMSILQSIFSIRLYFDANLYELFIYFGHQPLTGHVVQLPKHDQLFVTP